MTTLTIRISRATAVWTAMLIVAVQPRIVLSANDEAEDPHWNKATCQACHVNVSPTAEALGLQAENAEELCEGCHSGRGSAKPCRHSSDILVGDFTIPEGHQASLKDGRIACTTCHDLAVQCLNPSRSYSYTNPSFVRDRTSRNQGEYCFKCHDATAYEQLNPHTMELGDPAQPTCTFCHATMPQQDERGWISVDFNMPGSLNDMCRGCHKVQPHPGSMFSSGPIDWNHLAVPSAEILENMKYSEQTLGFILPLDPSTGEIYCATCHNPHHEDLEGYPVATSPGTKHRLRVDDNCQACHDL